MRKLQLFIKRLFDIVVSFLMIVVLTVFPVLLVIPVLIRLTSKGPAVFTQDRAGKDGKVFKIYKFRTMLIPEESLDENGEMLEPKKRITKIGRILRKTSLDELMQLFNVLGGTMSFVGPRPTLPYQTERYDERQRKRLDMRPGITGWAQVNGRNELTWTEKIEFDVEYVEKFSLWFDIKILFRTVAVVFKQEGIAFTKNDAINAKKNIPSANPKKALVLCGGLPQKALIEELKRQGIYTILADMNEKVCAREAADKFYPVSVFDLEALKKVALEEKVDYILTCCADQVLEVVAKLCEELGLPWYIDADTAEKVSKKSYMKQIFAENGVPTTKFVVLDHFDEAALEGFSFPLITKPVDAYSSRGVCKVHSMEELRSALEKAISISRTKTAIVEEFAEGNEITVDLYVENGKAHVLCMTDIDKIGEDGKFIINRSHIPACVSPEIAEQIADAAQKIATGFGLLDCPMLIQLISDGTKISVVEFCARTGGGIKFLMIKKACGFDVVKAVVDLTLGKKPHVGELTENGLFTVNEFIYCRPGVLKGFEGFEELLADGTLTEFSYFKAPGHSFGEIAGSGDRAAWFSIEAESREALKKRHAEANRRIRILSENGEDLARHELLSKYSDQ